MASPPIEKPDIIRKLLVVSAAMFLVAAPIAEAAMHAAGRQSQAATQQTGIQGTWQGSFQVPNGQPLREVVKISGTAPNNLKVMMYSIDQGGQPTEATSASFQGGVFKCAVESMDSNYEGKMSADGGSISGAWKLGTATLPLVFERATPETEWTIPPPPPKLVPMAASADPSFEVATIKPSKRGEQLSILLRGREIVTTKSSLSDLIEFAYGVQQTQIVGGAKWISSGKFDVAGQPDVPGVPDMQQTRTMLAKLLADRFQLKFHRETKNMPAYVLTVAKSGPKMQKGDPNGISAFGFTQLGMLMVSNTTMKELASLIQMAASDRPVVDETGLQGRWNSLLRWTPDESQFSAMGLIPLLSNRAGAPPLLFTAIQEQTGLKLEAGKAQVPVLVIDHVEPPSPN